MIEQPAPTTDLPILTAPEVAELTGYDVSTICRWAKHGNLRPIRKLPGPRGAYLFEPDVLRTIRVK